MESLRTGFKAEFARNDHRSSLCNTIRVAGPLGRAHFALFQARPTKRSLTLSRRVAVPFGSSDLMARRWSAGFEYGARGLAVDFVNFFPPAAKRQDQKALTGFGRVLHDRALSSDHGQHVGS